MLKVEWSRYYVVRNINANPKYSTSSGWYLSLHNGIPGWVPDKTDATRFDSVVDAVRAWVEWGDDIRNRTPGYQRSLASKVIRVVRVDVSTVVPVEPNVTETETVVE